MIDLARLPDTGLAFLERRLEMKLAALRLASSAVAQAMYVRYLDRLNAVRRELERRALV